MSFLDHNSNLTKPEKASFWNPVTSGEELRNILLASTERPQILFKHSPSCGTSYYAKETLEQLKDEAFLQAGRHMIDVIRQRAVSMQFAELVGIRHESPQIFVIRDGEVVWHTSHTMITPEKVLAALESER